MTTAPGLARLASVGLALWAFFWAPGAQARPYTVDDLLRLEVFAGVESTADGRWLVIQTYGPASAAGRYGDDGWPQPELSRLYQVDLEHPASARLIYPVTPGAGVLPGPLSPAGGRMVVYQLKGLHWRAGVLDLTSRKTRWLTLSPELAVYGRTVQWVDETTLAAIALPEGAAPSRVAMSWATRTQRPLDWSATARGEQPAFRIMGSGRFAEAGRPPAQHHFVMWDLQTGRERTLATGDFLDLEVSPDGRHAALLEEEEAAAPEADETVRVGSPSRRRGLRLINLARGGSLRPCSGDTILTHLLSWSASGDKLLVARADPGRLGEVDLVVVKGADGACEPISLENLSPRESRTGEGIPFVHAGWLGEAPLAFLERADARSDRADWWLLSQSGPINLTADIDDPPAQIAAIDSEAAYLAGADGVWRIAKGALEKLGAGLLTSLASQKDLSSGDRFAKNPPSRARTTFAPSDLVESASYSDGVEAQGPSGEILWRSDGAAVLSTKDGHGVTRILLATKSSTTTLLTLNSFLEAIDPPTVQALIYKTASGSSAKGWLYLPAHAKAKSPLIVIPYPGAVFEKPPTLAELGQPDFALGVQVLLGAGFAVLEPSLPTDRRSTNPARGLTSSLIAAADAAVATGTVDPRKIALFGHSFGAYAALVAAAESRRFTSVIAYAAPINLTAAWGAINPLFSTHPTFDGVVEAEPGWADAGQGHLWASPWIAPERYIHNSPLFMAANLAAPTLLVTADHDFVGMSQSESLFSALRRQGRDAALLTFWGEGHEISSPANVRTLFAAIEQWLGLTLDVGPVAPSSGIFAGACASAAPSSNPGFRGDQLKNTGVVPPPDKILVGQAAREVVDVNQPLLCQGAFQKKGPQPGQALNQGLAIKPGQIPLGPPPED